MFQERERAKNLFYELLTVTTLNQGWQSKMEKHFLLIVLAKFIVLSGIIFMSETIERERERDTVDKNK